MSLLHGKLQTEFRTISAMMVIYCRDHHGGKNTLCPECQALLDYAETRLDRCPYGEDKAACKHCPVHCYKAEQKQQIRQVMRYGGPRMLWRHPLLAIRHLLNERKQFPPKPPQNASNRAKRQQK
ncbi:nitrous oxide-stimulated promoter family protein [Shewanella sp. A32]|uniref:nitrous oxide-stimulated promoter family protein n=1 Tax=Shewanella sp. A32 TaxID=3031327 RepID=UPI0023BA147E|nr:nitrous oxide-stimulated promoter family protein [Shewanella sp. A32]MDF0535039.1 nitrous oxide-stimulated promoter family protein [Shewanella sp. A32]